MSGEFHLTSDRNGKANVYLHGRACGQMWLTDRGCAYRHTQREMPLSRDDLELLTAVMRAVEVFQEMDDE